VIERKTTKTSQCANHQRQYYTTKFNENNTFYKKEYIT